MTISKIEAANRQILMDATIACLNDVPLNKLTILHVAKRAGMVRQTVYNYYTNKNELLAATFEREGLKMAEQVALHIKDIPDIGEKFVQGFVYVVENFPKNALLAKVIEPASHFLSDIGMSHYPFATFGSICFAQIFEKRPDLKQQAEEISELWVRNSLSFLSMPAATNRSSQELAGFVRRRLLPGLHLI